ncbi:hypothetical protein F8S13_20595 [Chloroflexia bacterium SDU3-3]|nr:hypothetical protein F8S13_20595 [Chloroflexia bacterium SDU3-3]
MRLTAASGCETMPTSILMENTAITNIQVARVQRILKKLAQVKATHIPDKKSSPDQFQLVPPLSEAEVQAFEAEHRIRLPEDYRAFLIHAGNGGAGPIYGLYSLDKYNDFADWVEDEIPDDFLARPCPLSPGMPQTPDWREPFGDTSPYQGTLTLGSRGCTFETQLIVAGPYAGRVIYVDADEHAPPYFVREPDFLAWYERWLDELMLGYNQLQFGYGPGGGELELWQILDDPQADGELKGEAAAAFWRLPRLSDETIRRFPTLLESSSAEVRSNTLIVARKFKLKSLAPHAIVVLDDVSADVRKQAVYTMEMLAPQRWVEPVRKLLWEDPDRHVASTAFYQLKKARALIKPDLLRIVTTAPPHLCRAHAIDAGWWGAADAPMLIKHLEDEEQHVQYRALVALQRLHIRSRLPAIINLLSHEAVNDITNIILKLQGKSGQAATVPVLLKWARCGDDLSRLAAMDALAKIGDERAIPIAQRMLREERPPMQKKEKSTHGKTIAALVRASLEQSPNPRLRALAR